MNDELAQSHLTDDLFVEYSMEALAPARKREIDRHLTVCSVCADEVARLKLLSAFWRDQAAVAALERRVQRTLFGSGSSARVRTAVTVVDNAFKALSRPFAVSMQPLILPQGAYGATLEDEATSTLEFFVTQEGKIVEGLRGLLKRVNREYYVRIFAVDPGARTEYGDRKAVISISDTYQERPILHRRIDIGVTVLLGTDFRLTDNSCLEVEMLPPTVV